MTKEIFEAHKQGITEAMRETLTMSKALGRPLKPYCIAYDTESIEIHRDTEEDELRHLMQRVHDLMQRPNTTMTMIGQTQVSGRYDLFNSVEYVFKTERVADTIYDYSIEKAMKNLVKKHLGLKSYEHLECKVMQLFKDGLIEWEQVVEAHKGECKI